MRNYVGQEVIVKLGDKLIEATVMEIDDGLVTVIDSNERIETVWANEIEALDIAA